MKESSVDNTTHADISFRKVIMDNMIDAIKLSPVQKKVITVREVVESYDAQLKTVNVVDDRTCDSKRQWVRDHIKARISEVRFNRHGKQSSRIVTDDFQGFSNIEACRAEGE